MPPWLSRLATLKAARTAARGIAPHKPLMLLTVIDLIESGDLPGDLPDGWVRYDVRLVSRFRDYWELVQERQRNAPDIPMPFHALGGDRVWLRFTRDGQPSLAKATTRLCQLDPELFDALQDNAFRRQARETLIAIYFTPREQVMLSARLGLPAPMPTRSGPASARAATPASKATSSAATTSPAPSPATGSIPRAAPSSKPPTSTSTPSAATTIPATASPSRPTPTGCSTPACGPRSRRATIS